MTASYELSERPARQEDLARLDGSVDIVSLGCAILVGLPLAAGAYALCRLLPDPYGDVLGILAAIAVACWMPVGFYRWRQPGMRRERVDAEAAIVEVVTVIGGQPIEIAADHSSVEPAYAFELDDDRTLVMMGSWLSNPETYGKTSGDCESEAHDDADNYSNFLVPPCAFPVDQFRLHRFRKSGAVIRIEILGSYVAPTTTEFKIDLRPFNDSPTYLVDGGIDGLESSLRALCSNRG